MSAHGSPTTRRFVRSAWTLLAFQFVAAAGAAAVAIWAATEVRSLVDQRDMLAARVETLEKTSPAADPSQPEQQPQVVIEEVPLPGTNSGSDRRDAHYITALDDHSAARSHTHGPRGPATAPADSAADAHTRQTAAAGDHHAAAPAAGPTDSRSAPAGGDDTANSDHAHPADPPAAHDPAAEHAAATHHPAPRHQRALNANAHDPHAEHFEYADDQPAPAEDADPNDQPADDDRSYDSYAAATDAADDNHSAKPGSVRRSPQDGCASAASGPTRLRQQARPPRRATRWWRWRGRR